MSGRRRPPVIDPKWQQYPQSNPGVVAACGRDLAAAEHFIYRHFDADGAMLYVGCTACPDSRPFTASARPWLAEVDVIIIDGPYERSVALDVEDRVMKTERPLYNIQLENGGRSTHQFRAERAAREAGLPEEQCWDAFNNAQRPTDLPDLTPYRSTTGGGVFPGPWRRTKRRSA